MVYHQSFLYSANLWGLLNFPVKYFFLIINFKELICNNYTNRYLTSANLMISFDLSCFFCLYASTSLLTKVPFVEFKSSR